MISRRGPKPPGLFAGDDDDKLIRLWIHGRAPRTREQYLRELTRLLAFTRKPARSTTLEDLQDYGSTLTLRGIGMRHSGEIIKSFFGFAHSIGATPFNVAAAWRLPRKTGTVLVRILDEEQVYRLIGAPDRARDRCLIRVLYGAGLRVSEACGLLWAHVQPHGAGGVLLVTGKGNKNRAVRVSPRTYSALKDERVALGAYADDDDPVFRSRMGNAMHPETVRLMVRDTGRRIGIRRLSPHWLRHSHASHALDHGAPIHIVKETLGHSSIATTGIYLHARPETSSSDWLKV